MIQVIELKDLKINCLIGVYPHEREIPQDVFVDLYLEGDWSQAIESDDVADTLDYDVLSKELSALLVEGQYQLIETATQKMAHYCQKQKGVSRVKITLKKPEALETAQYSAFTVCLP